jgi:hypothetical protein
MAVFRIKKRDNPYAQIDRAPLEDARLSFKARGILAYLLCKPDGWLCRVNDLITRSPDGRDSVKSGLAELRRHHYARLVTEQGGGGQLVGTFYDVYENPRDNPEYHPAQATETRQKPTKKAAKGTVSRQTENPSDGETVGRENTPPPTENPSDGKPVGRENRPTENPAALVRTSSVTNQKSNEPTSPSGAADAAEGQGERFKKFIGWVKQQCPHLVKVERLVTESQLDALLKQHSKENVAAACRAIDSLYEWMAANTPRVLQMPTPIQLAVWFREAEDKTPPMHTRSRAQLEELLYEMQNHKPLLTRNTDTGLTLYNWLKRRDASPITPGSAAAAPTRVGTSATALLAKQQGPIQPTTAP